MISLIRLKWFYQHIKIPICLEIWILIFQKNETDVNRYLILIYTNGFVILNKKEAKYVSRETLDTLIDHWIPAKMRQAYNLSLIEHHFADHRILLNIDIKTENMETDKQLKIVDNLTVKRNNDLNQLKKITSLRQKFMEWNQ